MRQPKPKLSRFPTGWAPTHTTNAPAKAPATATATTMPICKTITPPKPCNQLNCQEVALCGTAQCGPGLQPFIDNCEKGAHPTGTCTSRFDSGLINQPCTNIPCRYVLDCQSQCNWSTDKTDSMNRDCTAKGQSPIYSPISAVGTSATGPGPVGSPPGDVQQMGKATTDAATSTINQLNAMTKFWGDMSKNMQDFVNWASLPCKIGPKYQAPMPCWLLWLFGIAAAILIIKH
jgi:hypothetical protein